METTSNRLWNRHKQEIRHDYNALYWSKHVGDDTGSLSPERDVEFCSRQSEYGFHCSVFIRMHFENICITPILLQRTLEYV